MRNQRPRTRRGNSNHYRGKSHRLSGPPSHRSASQNYSPLPQPIPIYEVHVHDATESRWCRILKDSPDEPSIWIHLSQPNMLKVFIGHVEEGVQVDYADVSIVRCQYLEEKSESEAQIRIWSTAVSPDGGYPEFAMSRLERGIYHNVNGPINNVVRDEGVADVLIVGLGRELEQHILTLDSSGREGSEVRHAERLQPRNRRDIPTQRQYIRWDSPIPGSPPGSRAGQHQTQQEAPLDPFPGREIVKAPPPYIPMQGQPQDIHPPLAQANVEPLNTSRVLSSPHVHWKSFHSKCSTCTETFQSGPARHKHSRAKGHPNICVLCEPPSRYNAVYHLYVHYKETGHTDMEQPKSHIGTTNVRNDKSVQLAPVEHIPVRIKEEPGVRTITTTIRERPYDPSIEFGDSVTNECQIQRHKEGGLGEKGPQAKRRKIRHDMSQAERGGKKRSENGKTKSTKTMNGDFKEPIVDSEINSVQSLSLSPEQHLQENKTSKKRRSRFTDADTNTLPLPTLSPPPSRKMRETDTPQPSKAYTHHDSRSLHTSSLTSLSLTPSFPLLPPRASSLGYTATFATQNQGDQRRLKEILDKKFALDLEEDELRLKRDRLKLEEEQLKLEMRRRQLADTVNLALSPTTSAPSPEPSVVKDGRTQPESGSSATAPKKRSPLKTCGACGELGHNRLSKGCRLNTKYANTK